jgi:hypothetical protein
MADFKITGRYEVIGFIGFVGLLEFIELLGVLDLRVQILYETRIKLGNDFSLIINPFKIIFVDIFLI